MKNVSWFSWLLRASAWAGLVPDFAATSSRPVVTSLIDSCLMLRIVGLLMLIGAGGNSLAAVTRADVLECGLADGSQFELHSTYDWSLSPFPAIHSSRETNRTGWDAFYVSPSGQREKVPASVPYAGKSALRQACAYFGMKNGVPLAPFTFRRQDGSWAPQETIPMERLDVARQFLPAGSPVLEKLHRAGIKSEAFNFGWIFSAGGKLVFEKPLFRADEGYAHAIPIDAVFQSFSTDGGATWSEAQISTDARIFELGRGRIDQSIRASPHRLNGNVIRD